MEREIGRPRPVLSPMALKAAALALCLAAVPAFLSSCKKAEPSFQMLLARIDAKPVPFDAQTFAAAAALTESTVDRLRLLKRARAHGPQAAAYVASQVLDGGAVAEPVLFASASIFLDAGLPLDALALFDAGLSAEDRPGLFAEAWINARYQGLVPPVAMANLVSVADALGQPDFLVDGALIAMAGADVATAAALLLDAAEKGAEPPLRLLWDASAWDALADRAPRPGDPSELHLSADAALLSGQRARAVSLYLETIETYPDYSYKPYAALARLSASDGAGQDASDLYGIPFAPAWTRLDGQGSSQASPSFLDRLAKLFPTNEDAILERAWYRLSAADPEGATSVLAALKEDSDASLSMGLAALVATSPDRAAPSATRLAADRPDSISIREAALACLVSLGSWKEFLALLRSSPPDLPRSWFWDAVALALEGEPQSAASVIRSRGAGFPPRVASYNLGIMELAAGRPAEAALAFVTAAGEDELPGYDGLPGLPQARCWEMAGKAWAEAGDAQKARGAYRSALSLEPDSLAARSGLELLP